MPSVSAKQARFMAAAAHNAKFAAQAGIDQGTAREFNRADAVKGMARHMARGKHKCTACAGGNPSGGTVGGGM